MRYLIFYLLYLALTSTVQANITVSSTAAELTAIDWIPKNNNNFRENVETDFTLTINNLNNGWQKTLNNKLKDLRKSDMTINLTITGETIKSIEDSFLNNTAKYIKTLTLNMPKLEKIGDSFLPQATKIEAITLPNSLTEIGHNFLNNNHKLLNIDLPSNLEKIGNDFLHNNSALENLIIPEKMTKIQKNFLSQCFGIKAITVPANVEKIDDGFLQNCQNLEILTFNTNKVTELKDHFLEHCEGLQSLTLPHSIKKIGNNGLSLCAGLTEITLPNALEKIGNDFLSNCISLEQLILPNALEKIGDHFLYSTPLKTITLPNSLKKIGDSFLAYTQIKNLSIPLGITDLGDSFLDSTKITDITIPNSVTKIGNYFLRNTKIIDITIPNSVTKIGSYFLYGCKDINTINIHRHNNDTIISKLFFLRSITQESSYYDQLNNISKVSDSDDDSNIYDNEITIKPDKRNPIYSKIPVTKQIQLNLYLQNSQKFSWEEDNWDNEYKPEFRSNEFIQNNTQLYFNDVKIIDQPLHKALEHNNFKLNLDLPPGVNLYIYSNTANWKTLPKSAQRNNKKKTQKNKLENFFKSRPSLNDLQNIKAAKPATPSAPPKSTRPQPERPQASAGIYNGTFFAWGAMSNRSNPNQTVPPAPVSSTPIPPAPIPPSSAIPKPPSLGNFKSPTSFRLSSSKPKNRPQSNRQNNRSHSPNRPDPATPLSTQPTFFTWGGMASVIKTKSTQTTSTQTKATNNAVPSRFDSFFKKANDKFANQVNENDLNDQVDDSEWDNDDWD
jgi:hypothetical protein